MNNTALGVKNTKKQEIVFISEAHEKFYYEKLKEVRYQDVYHKALCYCLGISDDTRRNINSIYDFKSGCVKPECLLEGWQTSGSMRVIRMAFNLYTRVSEHFTQPPKHFTEDSLLSAMERAGSEDMDDDVERKGLGTPATRADIIEKLVKDGFVKREKKQMIPTEDGMKLITVLPDVIKSPKLTADWENELTQVSKGEVSAGQFMAGIKAMVSELVKTYHSVSEEQKNMFGAGNTQEVFGTCPKCGGDVVKGKFGAYCKNKCGMNVSKALGVQLSDAQVKSLLAGKKILIKGLKGKKGNYDAYLIPESIENFSYTKDGKKSRVRSINLRWSSHRGKESRDRKIKMVVVWL